jgi:hypothetical protein
VLPLYADSPLPATRPGLLVFLEVLKKRLFGILIASVASRRDRGFS